jgi:hypothetical protein
MHVSFFNRFWPAHNPLLERDAVYRTRTCTTHRAPGSEISTVGRSAGFWKQSVRLITRSNTHYATKIASSRLTLSRNESARTVPVDGTCSYLHMTVVVNWSLLSYVGRTTAPHDCAECPHNVPCRCLWRCKTSAIFQDQEPKLGRRLTNIGACRTNIGPILVRSALYYTLTSVGWVH